MSSVSPLLLPITDYTFVSRGFASPAVTFSESVTLTATGELQGATSLAFSESVTGTRFGRRQASVSIDFSDTAAIQGIGPLAGSEAIAFSEQAIINRLSASTSIAFSESVTPKATGSLLASEVVDFLTSVSLTLGGGEASYNISPLVLPVTRYAFAVSSPSQFGNTSIDFSVSATLTAKAAVNPDAIRGSTSIADVFDAYVWLEGKGQLQAATAIAFSETANLNFGNLAAATSIAWTNAGAVAGKGALQAAESIAFSEAADIIGKLRAATSIAFSESVSAKATGKLSALTVVRFLNAGMLIRPVFGSTSIGITATAGIQNKVTLPDPLPDNVIPISNEYPKSSQSHVIKVNRGVTIAAKGTRRRVSRSSSVIKV